jgi:hypothetical protein
MLNLAQGALLDVRQGDYLLLVALGLLVMSATWRVYHRVTGHIPVPWFPKFFGLTLQIGIILGFERLYEFSRAHVNVGQLTALAYHNGLVVANFEITHGFFFEQRFQALVIHDRFLMYSVYFFYAFAHLFVTLGFLVWVYLRRNYAFAFVRNLFYVTSALALAVFMLYPTAPPRLFPYLGFKDPSQTLHMTPAGGAQAGALLYNPYAAMPSLHMGFSLIVGLSLVVVGKRLWLRIIGGMYPVLMFAVVIVSANHWILDGLSGAATVAVSALTLVVGGRAFGLAIKGGRRITPIAAAVQWARDVASPAAPGVVLD